MKGDHIFESAQREWENPPEFGEVTDRPEHGICPYCLTHLEYGEEGTEQVRCLTKDCKFDAAKTENQNRDEWLARQGIY